MLSARDSARLIELQESRPDWIRRKTDVISFHDELVIQRQAMFDVGLQADYQVTENGYYLLPLMELSRVPARHIAISLGGESPQLLPLLTRREERHISAYGWAWLVRNDEIDSTAPLESEDSIAEYILGNIEQLHHVQHDTDAIRRVGEKYPWLDALCEYLNGNRTLLAVIPETTDGITSPFHRRVIVSGSDSVDLTRPHFWDSLPHWHPIDQVQYWRQQKLVKKEYQVIRDRVDRTDELEEQEQVLQECLTQLVNVGRFRQSVLPMPEDDQDLIQDDGDRSLRTGSHLKYSTSNTIAWFISKYTVIRSFYIDSRSIGRSFLAAIWFFNNPSGGVLEDWILDSDEMARVLVLADSSGKSPHVLSEKSGDNPLRSYLRRSRYPLFLADTFQVMIPIEGFQDAESYHVELTSPPGVYFEDASFRCLMTSDDPDRPREHKDDQQAAVADGDDMLRIVPIISELVIVQDDDCHPDRSHLYFSPYMSNIESADKELHTGHVHLLLRPTYHNGLRAGKHMSALAVATLLFLFCTIGWAAAGWAPLWNLVTVSKPFNDSALVTLLILGLSLPLGIIVRQDEHNLTKAVQSSYRIRLFFTSGTLFITSLALAVGVQRIALTWIILSSLVVASFCWYRTWRSAKYSRRRVEQQSDPAKRPIVDSIDIAVAPSKTRLLPWFCVLALASLTTGVAILGSISTP